jgi:hypothetical protein
MKKFTILLSILTISFASTIHPMARLAQSRLLNATTAREVYQAVLKGANSLMPNASNQIPLQTAKNSDAAQAVIEVMGIQGRNGSMHEVQALLHSEHSAMAEIAYKAASGQEVAMFKPSRKFDNPVDQAPIVTKYTSADSKSELAGGIFAGIAATLGFLNTFSEKQDTQDLAEVNDAIKTDLSDWAVQPPVQIFDHLPSLTDAQKAIGTYIGQNLHNSDFAMHPAWVSLQ